MALTKIKSSNILDGSIASEDLGVGVGGAASITDNGNATAITIDSSENVGIGCSPSAKLDVQSATGNTGFNYGTSTSPERGNLWYTTDGTGWKYNIGKVQSGSFTPQLTIQDNGNVGIGTVSPTSFGANSTLVTSSDSVYGGFISECTTNAVLGQLWSNASTVYLGARSNHPLIITTNNTERLRIDSSGHLSVGTSTAVSSWLSGFDPATGNSAFKQTNEGWLTVPYRTGVAAYYPSQGARPILWAADSGTHIQSWDNSATDGVHIKSSNGTTRLFVREDGNVGVGTSDPKRRVHIKGNSTHNSGWVTEHYDGGREYKNFYANKTHTSANAYHHLKTSIKTGDYIMYRLDLKGYSYGTSAKLDHTCVGYAYTSGQNISTANYNNGGSGSSSTYVSSDGYVVLKTHLGANGYYSGFQVSAKFEQPTGYNHVITTLAHTFTSSSSNQY